MKTSRETWTYLGSDRRHPEEEWDEQRLIEQLDVELELKLELLEEEDYADLVAYLEKIVERRPGRRLHCEGSRRGVRHQR